MVGNAIFFRWSVIQVRCIHLYILWQWSQIMCSSGLFWSTSGRYVPDPVSQPLLPLWFIATVGLTSGALDVPTPSWAAMPSGWWTRIKVLCNMPKAGSHNMLSWKSVLLVISSQWAVLTTIVSKRLLFQKLLAGISISVYWKSMLWSATSTCTTMANLEGFFNYKLFSFHQPSIVE